MVWKMLDPQDQVRFKTLVLPNLDAAFNLARCSYASMQLPKQGSLGRNDDGQLR